MIKVVITEYLGEHLWLNSVCDRRQYDTEMV